MTLWTERLRNIGNFGRFVWCEETLSQSGFLRGRFANVENVSVRQHFVYALSL